MYIRISVAPQKDLNNSILLLCMYVYMFIYQYKLLYSCGLLHYKFRNRMFFLSTNQALFNVSVTYSL